MVDESRRGEGCDLIHEAVLVTFGGPSAESFVAEFDRVDRRVDCLSRGVDRRGGFPVLALVGVACGGVQGAGENVELQVERALGGAEPVGFANSIFPANKAIWRFGLSLRTRRVRKFDLSCKQVFDSAVRIANPTGLRITN
jgi:hypothetical protein